MQTFLNNPNAIVIAVALLFIIFIMVLYFLGKKKEAKAIVYRLVLEAEQRFIHESGQGHLKYRQVITELHRRIPPVLKIFITEDDMHHWIQEAWRLMKDVTDGIEGDPNV